MVTKFKNHLARTNLARNTINSYVWTIEYFRVSRFLVGINFA